MSEVGERLSSMSIFERYLTVWVGLCIVGGIVLGKVAPGFAETLDGMAIHVNGAPVVSIPIAVCLFLMMYPIMAALERRGRDAVHQLGRQAVHDVRHRERLSRQPVPGVHRPRRG